jgi:hypothetical protein
VLPYGWGYLHSSSSTPRSMVLFSWTKKQAENSFIFVTHIENCRCQFQNLIMICIASIEDSYVIDAHFGITNSASQLGKFVNSRSQLATLISSRIPSWTDKFDFNTATKTNFVDWTYTCPLDFEVWAQNCNAKSIWMYSSFLFHLQIILVFPFCILLNK